jgi:type I restriction enzyme S subunit
LVSNFKVYKLGQLGRIVTGKTPPTSQNELFGDTYPFITPVDMHDVKNANSTERFLSTAGAQYQHRLMVPPGSIAVSCIGWQMGKTIKITRPSFTNQQLNTIIPHEWVNSDFLYYTLVTLRQKFFSIASGVGVRTPILNKSAFSVFEVTLPPFDLQCRIAAILSTYDDLIENNTRRIAILEEMARRIYEEWFVNYRFPGYESVPLVESELGLVPKGWQVNSIKSIAKINARSIKKGTEPTEVLYVDIASVSTGFIQEKQRYSYEDAPGRARRLVADGDIIWSCVRPNRRSYALIQKPVSNLVVSTGFAVITSIKVPFSYLYHVVTTDVFVSYLANAATGATYPAVNGGDFENALLIIPSAGLLQSFHEIAEPIMRLAENFRDKNTNLRQTRDLLLPRLISGELDVSTLPMPEDMAA